MTLPHAGPAKSSWPLLTLAVTSFIPGFGFFLAAAAVTWGLMSDRPRARLAIAIGVGGALFQIIGLGLMYWKIQDDPAVQSVRAASTTGDLTRIVAELERYRHNTGHYPGSLKQLVGDPIPTVLININDHSASIFGLKPYQYHLAGTGRSYQLFAVGPDGTPGTSDDIQAPPAADTTAAADSTEAKRD